MTDFLAVPPHRRDPLARVVEILGGASTVALTTHVNADGDGAGCQTALASWLLGRGKRVTIANPTVFPDRYRYLIPDSVELMEPGPELDARVRNADVVVVLDTGEPRRLGRVAKHLPEGRVIVLDHHPAGDDGVPGPGLRDDTACATGEILYDLFQMAGTEPWTDTMSHGVYVAIETDTGSFRFSNTSSRAHAIAADLIRRGVDPEQVYRRLHAIMTMSRIRMIRRSLDTLQRDPDLPITWITVPREVTHEMGASADDLDGIADYARNLEGTEVAITFRETLEGGTKISFRSNGNVDVNAVARQFGGGGHVKAAGALISGPVEANVHRVLEAVRNALTSMDQGRQRT
jgi:bifunctional oligoribonuclease and PAP phosphatase NrnA